ncbi:hypothetical protein OAA46_00855 [bacterium]|nr:hypothetical protein [bacterium]
MTTSDVVDRGNDTYMVTSVACPACGGTSKSASLALEKANQYCAKTSRVAVVHDIENQNLNAVGAGGSDLVFACVNAVSDSDMAKCYESGALPAMQTYGEDAVIDLINKVFPAEDDFGFSQLSNLSYPSEKEKDIILVIGSTYDKCQNLIMSARDPNSERSLRLATNSVLALMADLRAGKMTFGDYAKGYNMIYADLAQSNAQIARAAKEQRRSEANARLRASENLKREIRSASTPSSTVHCTSTGYGGTVSTTCKER